MSAVLAFVALVAVLAAAVARWERLPDWAVAAGAAALLVLVGSISAAGARDALEDLGPTVGFAAALLVLADGCRRAGLFAYLGAAMAAGARGRPQRLLGLVFVAAAGTTAVLSLDATIVLLTPVVFSTAARLRFSPRPHVYACTHLATARRCCCRSRTSPTCWPSMPAACRSRCRGWRSRSSGWSSRARSGASWGLRAIRAWPTRRPIHPSSRSPCSG